MNRSVLLGAALAANLGLGTRAQAHVIVGARVFPVTLTLDDPGVADEATMPQVVLQPGSEGSQAYAIQFEYDKTITPSTALIYNQGYDFVTNKGAKTNAGFENPVLTAKWQAYTNPDTESVISLGMMREFGGGAHTQSIGGDAYGATSPTIYAGQGAGSLPVALLRPFAISGELSYSVPDKRQDSAADNKGSPPSWSAGVSIQYSLEYLQSQVKDYGLPDPLGQMIPLVEFAWFSPAAGPANGVPSTFTIAPGFIYMANSYQVGLEALIPGNRAAGTHAGMIAQVHVFFDDMFPRSILGKPIFE